MSKGAGAPRDQRVILSVVDTGKSTIRMIFEVWYTLWHEAHH